MPSYGQAVTIQFVAWDTAANAPKTGDSANFTLRWVKDGASETFDNSASEVDSTNAPGIYKVTTTATESQCQVGTLCGKSSTANVVILPVTLSFENLPTASPAASGGLPTVGTSTGQINPSGGKIPATVAAADVSGSPSVTVAAYAGGQDPATLVLDTAASGHSTAGTVGKAIADAGSAGDPWATAIPGSYGTGTAGYIVGNRVDTTISSRLASGNVTVGGYAASQDPATYVLSTAAYKLVTDSSGRIQVQPGTSAGQVDLAAGKVKLDTTQAIPTSNTAETVGDALNAARAQAFGKWVLSGTTLRLYASDGSTVIRTFTLDSATAPTQRV